MKVLLTGAFGNVGAETFRELRKRGHEVTCFDVPSRRNRRVARSLRPPRVVWGDVRSESDLARAVAGQDVVIHLAFVIPHLSATGRGSETHSDWAREINVGGTRKLLQAIAAQPRPPSILFSSSLHVYGPTAHLRPPRTVDDPVNPIEHYARHKVECEEMVRASGLRWAIVRFAAVMPIAIQLDPGMFNVPPDNRMEFVHVRDVACALAQILETPDAWGRLLHIGGGVRCQLYYRDIAGRILEAMGVGMLPHEAFTRRPFATDWLDTSESQALLGYQRHTFDDYVRDVSALAGTRPRLIRAARPVARAWLLRRSPYWRRHVEGRGWEERVALITGASSGIGAATARRLASHGLQVALVARRAAPLQSLAEEIRRDGGRALVVEADLTTPDGPAGVLAQVRAAYGGVDVLVNCAGRGWYGHSPEMPASEAEDILRINVEALTRLTLLALPEMAARGSGHVVNLGSVVGCLPSQGVAVYAASKAYVHALSTALHRELRDCGVAVSVVHPGPVRTPFFSRAAARPSGLPVPAERYAIPPERVAARIWGVLRRPVRVAYVPRLLGLAPWLELLLGWAMDLVGPALLRRQADAGGVSL